MSMNALGVIGVGDASAIQHLQLPIPTVGADDLLVKIHGFSINPVRRIEFLLSGWGHSEMKHDLALT